MGCLRESIPTLSRSALHRCLVRHGISRLPASEETSSKRKTFSETQIGYVHVDSAQLRSAEGILHMFLAIDRVSKFAYVEFHATAEMATGAAFMRGVVAARGAMRATLTRSASCSPTTVSPSPRTTQPAGTPCAMCSTACATSTASSTG